MFSGPQISSALAGSERLPWISTGPSISTKLLALFHDKQDWVMLRVEPSTQIPLHRHQGEVHGIILSDRRRLEPGGRVLGPGDYAYEPDGHVDFWAAHGDESFESLFRLRGAVEYLDADRNVIRCETAASKADEYRRVCAERGIAPVDLYR